jgi:hypothetical protein
MVLNMENEQKQRRRHPGLTRRRDRSGRYTRRDDGVISLADHLPENSPEGLSQPTDLPAAASPRAVLAAIMNDSAAPPTARVAAAKILMEEARAAPANKTEAKEEARRSALDALSVDLMRKRQ